MPSLPLLYITKVFHLYKPWKHRASEGLRRNVLQFSMNRIAIQCKRPANSVRIKTQFSTNYNALTVSDLQGFCYTVGHYRQTIV